MENIIPNTDRLDRIKSKIRALLSKTTENGATKQEMESALEKANQLMFDNFIAEYDLKDVEPTKMISKSVDIVKSHYEIECGILYKALNKLFDCKCYYNKNKVTFFGYEDDVEMCIYFYTLICRSILKAKDAYQNDFDFHHLKSQGYHGKTLCASYIKGFVKGVSNKMCAMYEQRKHNIEQKYGLIVLKEEKVETEYKKLFGHFKKAKRKQLFVEMEVYEKGIEKGEKFNLSQGLNGDESNIKNLN